MPLQDGKRIGLGTWQLGERPEHFARDVRAVAHALKCGYRIIDTAERYAAGGAERVIGEALRGIAPADRARLTIVGKVQPENATCGRMQAACEGSIGRMRCEYIDLYLLHWPPARAADRFLSPLQGFRDLLRQGLIRSFGVSNFSEHDLIEWCELERRLGLQLSVSCNQVLYNLQSRGIECGLLPWHRANGIVTMAYSPLGVGALTGDATLTRIARERNATASQIALAWCLRDPDVIPIPKSADASRIEENLRAVDLQLSRADLACLDRAFPLRWRWLRSNPWIRRARDLGRRAMRC